MLPAKSEHSNQMKLYVVAHNHENNFFFRFSSFPSFFIRKLIFAPRICFLRFDQNPLRPNPCQKTDHDQSPFYSLATKKLFRLIIA